MNVGISIEDAFQEGKVTKEESAGSSGISGGNNRGKKPVSQGKAPEVNVTFPPVSFRPPYPSAYLTNPPAYPAYQAAPPQYSTPATSNYPRPNPSYQHIHPPNSAPRHRHFDSFGKPLSEIFSKLVKRGVLRPLDPRPFNSPLPPHIDPNLYCDFHQGVGHHTDQCRRLQYTIQDLIDQKVIPPPQTPNINHNPLPNHYHQANLIFTDIPLDLSHYIIPSTLPKPNVMIWEANDSCMIRLHDQDNSRDNSDKEEEPRSTKGRDMCWWGDSEEEVEATLTFGQGYEPTKVELREAHKRIKGKGKEVRDSLLRILRYDGYFVKEGEAAHNYDMPRPWFLPGFEVSTNCTIPDSPTQTKTQSTKVVNWSDNLSGNS